MMARYYRLEGHTPVPCDCIEWARAFEGDRRVALDRIDRYAVSTVFLGLDHRLVGEGPPLLFETMIFGSDEKSEDWQRRCSTWEEAQQQHAEAVRWARAKSAPGWEVVAGPLVEIDVEDGGKAKIARIHAAGDDGFFVVLHSWSEDRRHEFFDRLTGRRVRVTIEILDDVEPESRA